MAAVPSVASQESKYMVKARSALLLGAHACGRQTRVVDEDGISVPLLLDAISWSSEGRMK